MPMRTGVNIRFQGIRVTAQVQLDAKQKRTEVQRSDISHRWGFKVWSHPILDLVTGLFRGAIERNIVNMVNGQLSRQMQRIGTVDLSKFIPGAAECN